LNNGGASDDLTLSYLAFARAQEASGEATAGGLPSDSMSPNEVEQGYHQVRQLIKQAIELPTPENIASFLNFSTAFRRLGIWNARMAYIQRPGARVIASEYEWTDKELALLRTFADQAVIAIQALRRGRARIGI
jgi:selenocysteine lyase/cysteine desulfurase